MSEFWLTSPLFVIEPGEDEETNPHRFGKQLAQWLVARLREVGYAGAEAVAEDWGWCVLCERKPFRLWVGCGNVEVDLDSAEAVTVPEASAIVWHCFVVAEPSWVQRLLRSVNPSDAVRKLSQDLEHIFRDEPAITLVEEP